MSDPQTVLYEDAYISLKKDERGIAYLSVWDSAQCVPLTDSGMVIFIIEPSPAYHHDILTLPGGIINPKEPPDVAANRELQEEIGYIANHLDFLGELRPWVKYLRARQWVYLARHLTPSVLVGDEAYDIRTELVPLSNFERLINAGRLHDSSVIASLYMARHFIEKEDRAKGRIFE